MGFFSSLSYLFFLCQIFVSSCSNRRNTGIFSSRSTACSCFCRRRPHLLLYIIDLVAFPRLKRKCNSERKRVKGGEKKNENTFKPFLLLLIEKRKRWSRDELDCYRESISKQCYVISTKCSTNIPKRRANCC